MAFVPRLEDIKSDDAWTRHEPGRSVAAMSKNLLHRVWAPREPQRILEVNCGSGELLDWLASRSHQVTGLDSSPAMLEAARRRLPPGIQLDLGHADHLPYDDNTFDTVALITTLEMARNPAEVLAEACRVARSHVLIGAMNRYSIVTLQRCWEDLWRKDAYRKPRFFSVLKLEYLVWSTLGGTVPIRWKTCFFFPLKTLRYLRFLEGSPFFQWHPLGHFIAMRVDLRYPLQTIQNPLFCKIPSPRQETSPCSSCLQGTRLLKKSRSTSRAVLPTSESCSSQEEMFL